MIALHIAFFYYYFYFFLVMWPSWDCFINVLINLHTVCVVIIIFSILYNFVNNVVAAVWLPPCHAVLVLMEWGMCDVFSLVHFMLAVMWWLTERLETWQRGKLKTGLVVVCTHLCIYHSSSLKYDKVTVSLSTISSKSHSRNTLGSPLLEIFLRNIHWKE